MASIPRALTRGSKLPFSFKPSCQMSSVKAGRYDGRSVSTFQDILSDQNKIASQRKLKAVDPVHSIEGLALKSGQRCASLLVPLCTVNQEPSFLFTLISSRVRQRRGEVSFPGGNCDDYDADVVQTALRHTEEKLGIMRSEIDVWGLMKPLPSSDGNRLVHPMLARIEDIDIYRLRVNHDEVEEVFTVPLRHLCDPNNAGSAKVRSGDGAIIPVYTGAAHKIWGLTAIIVHHALNIIAPGLYSFKVQQQQPIQVDQKGSPKRKGDHPRVG